jgi:superfamily II DNA or RNA helicase
MEDHLKLYVDNTSTLLSGRLKGDLYKGFKRVLGYQPEDYMWRQGNNPHWDGYISCVCYNREYCKCAVKKDGMHFPTGLLSQAKAFLDEKNVPYEIVDVRSTEVANSTRTLDLKLSSEITPHPYQQAAIDKAINAQRGIIKAATGSGKTFIGSGIVANIGVSPSIFYVTSIDLLEQAKNELERFITLNGKQLEVGVIGGGKKKISDVTVMTVQTAVRALDGKYSKFDDEDSDDNTDISDIKTDIVELIRSAKLYVADECQHWKSETCQIIADNSLSARWRYALSATPYRDAGDDILINACFGKDIVDINASWLIRHNFLVKPQIAFIPINNMKGMKLGAYPSVYKEALVDNPYRNELIAKLATNLVEQGRITLVLVQQIAHGEELQRLIPNSVFLHGSSTKKDRQEHLNEMRTGKPSVTISSSLPYKEMVAIKLDGLVKHVEIGELCHNYDKEVRQSRVQALCSKDGKTLDWSNVTALHIHKRENRLVRVQTDKNEDTIVTENHSLVDSDLNQCLPSVGNKACVPQTVKNTVVTQEFIDVIDLLKNCDKENVEVELMGLTQPLMRKLRSDYQWFLDKKKLSKSTRLACDKRCKDKSKEYFLAIGELLLNFHYYKFRYRSTISQAAKCKYVYDLFEARIYIRRSRNTVWLPAKMPINESLGKLYGLLVAEGHINKAKCASAKSMFNFVFTGMIHTTDGKYCKEKQNIRSHYIQCIKECFKDVNLTETDIQIKSNSKLLYIFSREICAINSTGEKRVPNFVFNAPVNVKDAFLYGYYLGDGHQCFYNGNLCSVGFTTSSRPLFCGIWLLLQMLGHRFNISYDDRKQLNTKARYQILTRDPVGPLKPVIKVEGRDYSISERTQKSVDYIDLTDEFVYDISVADCHNFIGGTVLDHNTIFDEGIDVKPLNSLILAGGGKSQTRALQRVGRVIRNYTYPDGTKKEDAFVYDFHDHQRYLTQHSLARRKIYRTEPEFEIRDVKI